MIELKITADSPVDLRLQLAALLGTTAAVVTAETPAPKPPVKPTAESVKTGEAQATAAVAPQATVAQHAAKQAETQASDLSQKLSDTSMTATTAAPAGGATSASPSDDAVIDYDRDVTPQVLAFAQKFGRDGVMELLKPFDVTYAKHIAPDKRPDLLAAISDRFAQEA